MMCAMTESQMSIWSSIGLKFKGRVENFFIAVTRGVEHHDRIASSNG